MLGSSATSSSSSSIAFFIPSGHVLLFPLLLILCSSSPFIHGHPKQAVQLTISEVNEQNGNKYKMINNNNIDQEDSVTLLAGQLVLNPSTANQARMVIEGEGVCAKYSDANATLIKSMSKSTGKSVTMYGPQQFSVSYCEVPAESEDDEPEECGTGSNCATIYRWAKTKVNAGGGGRPKWDEVLVPVDCLCVLNWTKLFHGQGPIIDESGDRRGGGEGEK